MVVVVLTRCLNHFQRFLASVNAVNFDVDRFAGDEFVCREVVLQSLSLNCRQVNNVCDAAPDIVPFEDRNDFVVCNTTGIVWIYSKDLLC